MNFLVLVFINSDFYCETFLTKSEMKPGHIINTRDWLEPGEMTLQVTGNEINDEGSYSVYCSVVED